ncbi:MAG: xanthine dehydrogenase family protein subunit M [Deltaproteobacteria bacterium]|nr:xanthine dehydrogenase family protein subunit M [Deltaproteobacteria bacterium]
MSSEYFRPSSIQEATRILEAQGKQAKVLAGGTDLVVLYRAGKVRPASVVSLNAIPGLNQLELTNKGLHLGALVTHQALLTTPEVVGRYSALADSARQFAGVQIRNLGTVGGNLCHASPSADMAPPLLVLNARAEIAGPKGTRVVELDQFFLGPNQTVLQPGEILAGLEVPAPGPASASIYLKQAVRGAMEIAMVGVAVGLSMANGRCREVRIALGAVAPTPFRAREAEGLLKGQELTPELMLRAGEAAAREARPISDVRCSAEYRREMVKVFTRRALEQALRRARGGR